MQDQTPVAVADQPSGSVEQAPPVPFAAPEAVPAGNEAVPFDYSQINDDWIREAAEKSAALKGILDKRYMDGENTGKQKLQRDLERERGSEEAIQQYHESVVRRLNAGEDPAVVLKDTPTYVKANRDAYWRGEVEKVIDAFNDTERAQIKDALDNADDVEARERISRQVLDFAIDRHSTNRIKSLSLTDVPEDSALRKSIQEHIETELAKERQALEQELKPKPVNPPTTPTGESIAAGDSLARFNSMTPTQRADYMATASDTEKSALWAAAAPR